VCIVKKVFSILLSLFVLLSVSSIGLADSTETDDAEALLAANRILENSSSYGDYDKITLSDPVDCYLLDDHVHSLVQAYTAKSLSPFYSTLKYRMFYVYGDGEPVAWMLLLYQDESWQVSSISCNLKEILDAQEKLAAAIPEETEICGFWVDGHAYVFTPDLWDGYIMAANGGNDTVYRTRDLLIEYYQKTKKNADLTTYEERVARAARALMGESSNNLIFLPDQTHSVLPFWCAVIGIPVIVVAGIVILVMRRKKVK
jgi:hypothetical protein